MSEAYTTLVACPSCDLLSDVGAVCSGQKAYCPRCGQFLTAVRADSFERLQAWSLSALIFLVIGCTFPFLSFKASGLESVMTLPQTALSMYREGMPEVALLVGAFIIVIPGVVMALCLLLATCLARGFYAPWLPPVTRFILQLQHWSMVEVFFIGVLVSLVKIAHMATVVIGVSFWGYAAFSLCFVFSLATLDRLQYWNAIERLGASEPAFEH